MSFVASNAVPYNKIFSRSEELYRFWQPRNKRMKEWYEMLQQIDVLAQKGMESFVGSDPRTSFNLLGSILKQRIPHILPANKLTSEQVMPAAELSSMFEVIWENIYLKYRQRGRRWLDDLVDFILATGWYSVFATMTPDGTEAFSEVWNPATVYPHWEDQLVEVAHIFTPGQQALQALCHRNGWTFKVSIGSQSKIRDMWWVDTSFGFNQVHNAVLIDQYEVKPDTIHPEYNRIPIFMGAVGGLPDEGELQTTRTHERWKGEKGQAALATNENIHRSMNRWWTFLMQLVRDTAQPRTYERSASSDNIVEPDTWNIRGAHYKMGLQDEVGFITPPPLPMELRSIEIDLEAMRDRGGPSGTMFGQNQGRVTAYTASLAAANTHQVTKPFHEGVVDCITDVDNFLLGMIEAQKLKPYGIGLPDNLPENVRMTASYEFRVPGDMAQRAQSARMLNSDYTMSEEFIMEHLFPEIKNPAEEMARVRAGRARRRPEFEGITLKEALSKQAELLRDVGDIEAANMYEKVAANVEQQLLGPQQPALPPGGGEPPGPRPEVIPNR